MRNLRTPGLAAVAGVMLLACSGCEWLDKLKARDNLNMGVASFKNAKYQDAVEKFKTSMALDPSLTVARNYLATAYMVQWIPGAESPENVQFAKQAKDEFDKVLTEDPKNVTALASLASLAYNQAGSLPLEQKLSKYDEAGLWYKKLIEVDPQNKEAFYSLGVIAWGKWYPALMTARAGLRMRPEDPGPIKDKKVKEELKTKYSIVIDDGIGNMTKALDIDKEYDDAMAYMNLLVREKADLADSKQEYDSAIQVADSWVQKALDTKKAKAAKQPTTGGIVNDAK